MQARFGRYLLAGLVAVVTIYLLTANRHRLPLLPASVQQTRDLDDSNKTQLADTGVDELSRVFNSSLGVRLATPDTTRVD
jgi:hypothetical protein